MGGRSYESRTCAHCGTRGLLIPPATTAEYSKAARIRRKRADATAQQRAWLDAYVLDCARRRSGLPARWIVAGDLPLCPDCVAPYFPHQPPEVRL